MLPSSKEEPKPVKQTLEEYKLSEYQVLGFTEYQAKRLLHVAGLDVGSVREVIQHGCSIRLAYRIFRP